jgi:hypothetical protein
MQIRRRRYADPTAPRSTSEIAMNLDDVRRTLGGSYGVMFQKGRKTRGSSMQI